MQIDASKFKSDLCLKMAFYKEVRRLGVESIVGQMGMCTVCPEPSDHTSL